MSKEQEVIRGVPDTRDVLTESITPKSELPPAPPSQPQQPAPENKGGGDKKYTATIPALSANGIALSQCLPSVPRRSHNNLPRHIRRDPTNYRRVSLIQGIIAPPPITLPSPPPVAPSPPQPSAASPSATHACTASPRRPRPPTSAAAARGETCRAAAPAR